jgi:heterodisulfide reductase subunit A2
MSREDAMGQVTASVLVVGGGPAGTEAALRLAQGGLDVVLVERGPALGGTLLRLQRSFPKWEDPLDLVRARAAQLDESPRATVLLDTAVESCDRVDDAFVARLRRTDGEEQREVVARAVVLATGFDLFDVTRYGEYGYGVYSGVMHSLEFEDQLKLWHAGDRRRPVPQAVAFIKCVGSRDNAKGFPYCSKICCMYTAKQAGLVKDLSPDAKCYVFYMDYRAAGQGYEEFVRGVIEEKGVRYVRGRPSKVLPRGDRLLVRAEDTLMGVPVEVEVDLVVLAAAVVPCAASAGLTEGLGATTDGYGFVEAEPGDSTRSGHGLFFAGACGFAVESAGARLQGAAAAAEVLAFLRQSEQVGS